MRSGPLILIAAAALAAVHLLGVLFRSPVVRYAEVLALLLLLGWAVLTGLPAPRWVVPVAVAVLVADALRTLPAVPGGGYGWFLGTEELDVPSGFEVGLGATWAALIVVVLIAVAGRGPRRPGRAVRLAAIPAVLVLGFAAVRVAGHERLGPASLAVLLPLLLALAAVGVAALLATQGHRLAAAGAVLLAGAALLHLDAALASVPQHFSENAFLSPGYRFDSPGLPLSTYPAIAAAADLTAVFLLIVGVTRRTEFRTGIGRTGRFGSGLSEPD